MTGENLRPSREALLQHLWSEVIESDHIAGALDVPKGSARDPNPPFADVSAAVQRILDAGVERDDFQRTLRYTAYSSIFAVLYALSDPGVSDGETVFGLYEELLTADPSGNEARPSPQVI